MLQVGEKVPGVDLFETSPANKVNVADLCANKKVIIFAVPGAFTPGCSKVCMIYLIDIYKSILLKKVIIKLNTHIKHLNYIIDFCYQNLIFTTTISF